MTSVPDPLLEVAGLCTRFFTKAGVVKAVEDVSFSVRRGGVLQPSPGAHGLLEICFALIVAR